MSLTSPAAAFAALPESQGRVEPLAHAATELTAEPDPCQSQPEPAI